MNDCKIGMTFNPVTGHLFISDETIDRIDEVKAS